MHARGPGCYPRLPLLCHRQVAARALLRPFAQCRIPKEQGGERERGWGGGGEGRSDDRMVGGSKVKMIRMIV